VFSSFMGVKLFSVSGFEYMQVTMIPEYMGFVDGRWVTDDYYEEKVLADITAKGLKAGDLVGELPDPNAPAHTQPDANLANSTFASSSNVNIAGGGGIYRAGGPTTIFGGSGWGPFSDGPLNAVRKSLLSRDGVTEENWMWMMAGRVGDADEEWGRLRKEGRGKAGMTVNGVVMGGKGSAWQRPDPILEDPIKEKPAPGEQDESNASGTDPLLARAGRKRKAVDGHGILGAYEPHSNMILCELFIIQFPLAEV
jgi:chromatin structure-remodeling complex protein RSC7